MSQLDGMMHSRSGYEVSRLNNLQETRFLLRLAQSGAVHLGQSATPDQLHLAEERIVSTARDCAVIASQLWPRVGIDGPVELCLCLRFTRDVPHPRQTRPSTNVIAIPRVPITVNVRVQRDVRAVAALAACRMLDEIAWSCGYPRSELFDENGNPVAHVVKLLEY